MRVDFHSHVVPGVDDGSKNTEMSLEMLRRMRRQGTDLVVATPHYYVGRTAPEEYLGVKSTFRRVSNDGSKPWLVFPRVYWPK